MLENQRKGSSSQETFTIITPIPSHAEVGKSPAHLFTVKWEKGVPVYLINEQGVPHQDFLDAINAQLSFPKRVRVILAFGLLLSAILAYSGREEMFLPCLAGGLILTGLVAWIVYAVSQRKRRVVIHFVPSKERDRAIAMMNAVRTEWGKVAQVWDYATSENLTIQSDASGKFSCDVPMISLIGLHSNVFWLPDQLYILTGRRCQAYPYQELRVESSTYRLKQQGKVPADARVISQHWLHQRKDGQPDKRYRENYKISTVEYGLLRFRTLTDDLFQIGISNSALMMPLTAVFRAFTQPLSDRKESNLSPLQSLPTESKPVRPLATPPPHNTKEVIYPLSSAPKEVLYPLTPSSESREKKNEVIYPLTGSQKEVFSPLPAQSETRAKNDAPTSHQQFLQDAQKYHTRIGERCEAVPFKAYWPTYASLNDEQKRWYFYWRTEARRGNFLPTDTSYLFLHAYEVLNLVEKKDPTEAAGYLKFLLQKYEKEHKELIRYFPEWIGDLAAEARGIGTALAWNKLKGKNYFSDELINLIVQHAADKNYLSQMPWSVWYKLADHHLNIKRFKGRISTEQLSEAHIRSVVLANVYWQNKTGKPVIEQFASAEPREIHKPLFKSAVMGRDYKAEISLGYARNYLGNQELRQHLAAVMGEAEKILLEVAGMPSPLSVTDLPSELKKVLRRYLFNNQSPENVIVAPTLDKEKSTPSRQEHLRSPLKIDLSRVDELERESEKLSQVLGTANDETAERQPNQQSHFPLVSEAKARNESPQVAPPEPAQPFKNPDGVWIFLGEEKAAPLQPAQPPPMPVLKINLARVEELQAESAEIRDLLTVEEEWQESPSNPENVANSQPATSSDTTAFDDEWNRFWAQLTAAEKELLKAFTTSGRLSGAQIRAIEQQYRAMALVDALCEKAFEILERNLIFQDDNHWAIEDDDLETLRLKLQEMEQA